MKKILLIHTPAMENSLDTRRLMPLGVAYLAAALRENSYSCNIIDGNIKSISITKIAEESTGYDMVGVSSYTSNFRNAVKIAEAIKELKDIPILLGSYHAIFEHDKIIKEHSCFDAIVRGEGERVLIALCDDYFANGKFTYPVNGVTYKSLNGREHVTDTVNIIEDLDNLSFPVRDGHEKYFTQAMRKGAKKQYMTIISSRGCPYKCSFCSITHYRNNWSPRSPENVSNEIAGLYQKFGDLYILFSDDNFYIDPERAKEIIRITNQKCGKVMDFKFSTRADQIIRGGVEPLLFFKANGCKAIEIGIESGSDAALKRFCKNVTAEQNQKAIEMVKSAGIEIIIDFIMFDPETTLVDLKKNIEFLKSVGEFCTYPPKLFNKIFPYPGTPFTQNFNPGKYNKYFHNENVCEIYLLMNKYNKEIMPYISKILDFFENNQELQVNDPETRLEQYFLVSISYKLFEALVECDGNYIETYKKVMIDYLIAEQICALKKKYEL